MNNTSPKYKVGDFFFITYQTITPYRGVLFMIVSQETTYGFDGEKIRSKLVGFLENGDVPVLSVDDFSLSRHYYYYQPTDKEKAFFLLKLENTKNE